MNAATPEVLNLAAVIYLIVSVFLPLLVGLITRISTHSGIKAVLLILANAVGAWLSQYIAAQNDHRHFDWGTTGLAALLGFALAVASHYGLWKQTGATAAVQNTLVVDKPAQAA